MAAGGVADDLVVDVGDVHDVADRKTGQLQGPAEHIDVEEGAEVTDVAVVVHGGAAGGTCAGLCRRRGARGSMFPVRVLKSWRVKEGSLNDFRG